ncbi:DUF1043 domain-containing protein [Marinomonas piezotolerans]|uniref:DUF1043 domain-containing protein n=1 Tax=Marinomonas piezotolerans TaxID=2213058 RepID=A0A370UDD2_9GAMM|nr:DUF1043 family protein [Marinomonas piezotolerans]RDL45788.1 DUF1043 domain-containing protein [Marinomonas piezotolerans]
MELEVFDIIVFVTGIIVGLAAALIFRAVSKKAAMENHRSTGATIESLQHELERRQVMSDDHFLQLNTHLQAVERKLLDVRKAVNEGAATLSTVEFAKPEADTDSVPESVTAAPPRDYATKDKTDEGMLSESFGLKTPVEEPKRTF